LAGLDIHRWDLLWSTSATAGSTPGGLSARGFMVGRRSKVTMEHSTPTLWTVCLLLSPIAGIRLSL
jgi:hypothetical protein